jgi:hypothetical protein
MEKKSSNWHFPADLGCFFFFWVWIAFLTFVSGGILPLVSMLRYGNALGIFYTAMTIAGVGTCLLFLARLPLYRQRRFWTVGPRELDRRHRQLYWLAHLFILASIGLLVIVWFRLR